MFRGRNQVDGKWVTQEYTNEEMGDFLKRVSEFNIAAWKESVRAAVELKDSDMLKPEQEFEFAKLMFDKLGLNTFSVVNNQSQHMRE